MREGPRKEGDVLPDEEILVFPNRVIYKIVAELLFVCPAMLVDNDAIHRQQAPPASFPGLIRKVGVFEIERIVQGIQPSHGQKLVSVEGARAATAPEDRQVVLSGSGFLWNLSMEWFNEAQPSAGFGVSRFLTSPSLVLKKHLAGDSEHRFVLKPIQQRLQEIRVDLHVVV